MIDPNEILLQSLHDHGRQEATLDSGWIVIAGYPPARAFAYTQSGRENVVNLQLDIEIALDDGRILVESTAGLGIDENAALESAYTKFSSNSLHPLLCAFYDYPVDEQIDLHRWLINGETWDIYMGPFSVMYVTKNGPPEQPEMMKVAPDNLSAFIEEQIKLRPFDGDTHWIRFFYGQQNGRMMASEALWDNDVWQVAQDKLSQLSWPAIDGFTTIRTFTVLRKSGTAKHHGSAQNAMVIEQALSVLVDYLGRNRYADDDAIFGHLVQAGITPTMADRIILFGPASFSSNILGEAYPTDYQVLSKTAPVVTHKLMSEPVFAVGSRYASLVAGDPKRKDAFMSVASRDAHFKAANRALSQGSKLEDLIFSPLMMFPDGYDEQLAAEHSERFANEMRATHTDHKSPTTPSIAKSEPKQKPWWRFW